MTNNRSGAPLFSFIAASLFSYSRTILNSCFGILFISSSFVIRISSFDPRADSQALFLKQVT